MSKTLKPYDVMKSAVDSKVVPSIQDIKKINSFFFVRYISNDPNTIYIANILNCNHTIPLEAQYNFVKYSTLDKVSFINYPKKEKILSDKDLKVIRTHFKINESVAKDYVKILGTEKTQEILDKYKNCPKKR